MLRFLAVLILTGCALAQSQYGADYILLRSVTTDGNSNLNFGNIPKPGFAPASSPLGAVTMYFDSTAGCIKASINGGVYSCLDQLSSTIAAGNVAVGIGGSTLTDSGANIFPISSVDTSGIQVLAINDNTVYTVPSGKLAACRVFMFNPTGGAITVFPTITPTGGATIFRIGANSALAAAPSNTSSTDSQIAAYLLASAGDALGVNATAAGVNAHVECLLANISNTNSWKQVILKTFSVGDNTVYTVPAGKTAYLGYADFRFFGTIGTQMPYINQTGVGTTISYNIVPNGGSPSAANRVWAPAATATESFNNFTTVKKMSAGDFVSINTTSNGKQFFSCIVLETTP